MRLVKEDCHRKCLEDGVEERACEFCLDIRLDAGALAADAALEA